MICSKRLQSYRTNPSLWLSSLVFAPSHLGFPLDSVERAPENKLDLLLHLVREVLHGAEVLAQKLPEIRVDCSIPQSKVQSHFTRLSAGDECCSLWISKSRSSLEFSSSTSDLCASNSFPS